MARMPWREDSDEMSTKTQETSIIALTISSFQWLDKSQRERRTDRQISQILGHVEMFLRDHVFAILKGRQSGGEPQRSTPTYYSFNVVSRPHNIAQPSQNGVRFDAFDEGSASTVICDGHAQCGFVFHDVDFLLLT